VTLAARGYRPGGEGERKEMGREGNITKKNTLKVFAD